MVSDSDSIPRLSFKSSAKRRHSEKQTVFGRSFIKSRKRADFFHRALGPDDVGDTQKRFASIFSQALLLFLTSDKQDVQESVEEAAQKIRKYLDQPADVIGGKFRSLISTYFNIVEQPITDVQTVCPDTVREPECIKALSKLTKKRIERCPEYSKNIDLYTRLSELSSSCGLQNFLLDLTFFATANCSDSVAVDFFVNTVSGEYSDTFFGLLITACIVKYCHGGCQAVSSDLNTKWRAADVLEQIAHDYYQSQALGPDDVGDTQKRFATIFSRALLLFLISDKHDVQESVEDAAQKIWKYLDQPADVIGGKYRSLISTYLNIVEQPTTDVQTVCPDTVREPECIKALSKLTKKRIERCPEYSKNIDLYTRLSEWLSSCGVQNCLQDLTFFATANCSDSVAIDFFVNKVSVEYSDTFKIFKDIFKTVLSEQYTCNSFSFL
ncbi:unnamed protein product [Parnassius mnemosyne]|uniref:Uncharacterized protein n=1 Tax=Parnassius mnemosyne TaxID=213953 RepID=A0AAV1L3P8_9NEOP